MWWGLLIMKWALYFVIKGTAWGTIDQENVFGWEFK